MDDVSPFEPTVVGAVGRHWRLVVVVVLLCVLPAGLYAFTRPANYTATASLTVGDPRGPGVLAGQSPEPPDRYVSDQLVVFGSAQLGDRAAKHGLAEKPRLNKPSSWYLNRASATATATDNNLLSVSFSAPSAAEAIGGLRATVAAYGEVAQIAAAGQANSVLAQLNSSIRSIDSELTVLGTPPASDTSATSQVQQLTLSRASLSSRRDQVAGEAAYPSSGVTQALEPNDASAAGKSAALRIMVLALGFGLLLGIGLAYMRSYRKRVFTHQLDPEILLGAPLLIDSSNLRAIDLVGLGPVADAPAAEARAQEMFAIAASLVVDRRFASEDTGLAVAIVSARTGASCTAVAWRIGLAFAAQGLRALLIDVESAWPPPAAWTSGVSDTLPWVVRDDGRIVLGPPLLPTRRSGSFVGQHADDEGDAKPAARKSGLYLCHEVPPVTSQKALRKVFQDLEDGFDVVLVNSPPFLASADAAHLASATGSAVVVVPAGSSVPDHEEIVRRLRLAASTPIGYVYCCSDCDVPNPNAGTGRRLKRALHVDSGAAPPKATGSKGTRLTTDRR